MNQELIPGKRVLINYNDEAGCDLYSVEYDYDPGNWIDSFGKLEMAMQFIVDSNFQYDTETGFRDSRYPYAD